MFDALLSEIESMATLPGELWFRGQSDERWPLLPRILRSSSGPIQEKNMLARFRSKAMGILPNPPLDNDAARWLFLMQHFGLPTRLLDWTESALNALYFATEGPDSCDGCLFLLKPMQLNASQLSDPVIYSPTCPQVMSIMRASFQGGNKVGNTLSVMAYASNDRIARQTGHFTVHGSSADLRQSDKLPWLKEIRIPGPHKKKLRQSLEYFGVSRTSLFNDLESLAHDLRHQHGVA